jgi:hypothetical protein
MANVTGLLGPPISKVIRLAPPQFLRLEGVDAALKRKGVAMFGIMLLGAAARFLPGDLREAGEIFCMTTPLIVATAIWMGTLNLNREP